jgi:group I intron endonuclease
MADQTLRQAGIYRITHVPSGLVYIGSSLDMHRRWRQHQIHLQSRKHDSKRLQAAWIDDGPSAFTIAVLEAIPGLGRTEADKGRLFAIEQAWLDKISPFLPAVGFNILPFAGSPGLSNHTPEARAKLSAATKRRYLSPEARAETAAAATNPSLEARAKMSAFQSQNALTRGAGEDVCCSGSDQRREQSCGRAQRSPAVTADASGAIGRPAARVATKRNHSPEHGQR